MNMVYPQLFMTGGGNSGDDDHQTTAALRRAQAANQQDQTSMANLRGHLNPQSVQPGRTSMGGLGASQQVAHQVAGQQPLLGGLSGAAGTSAALLMQQIQQHQHHHHQQQQSGAFGGMGAYDSMADQRAHILAAMQGIPPTTGMGGGMAGCSVMASAMGGLHHHGASMAGMMTSQPQQPQPQAQQQQRHHTGLGGGLPGVAGVGGLGSQMGAAGASGPVGFSGMMNTPGASTFDFQRAAMPMNSTMMAAGAAAGNVQSAMGAAAAGIGNPSFFAQSSRAGFAAGAGGGAATGSMFDPTSGATGGMSSALGGLTHEALASFLAKNPSAFSSLAGSGGNTGGGATGGGGTYPGGLGFPAAADTVMNQTPQVEGLESVMQGRAKRRRPSNSSQGSGSGIGTAAKRPQHSFPQGGGAGSGPGPGSGGIFPSDFVSLEDAHLHQRALKQSHQDFPHHAGATDFLHQKQAAGSAKSSSKRKAKSFPVKLMQALMENPNEDAVAWLPDGKSFVIVQPDLFVDTVLKKTFKECKYASFVRKLHRWGFVRLTSGTGTDCFHHPLFQQNRIDMCSQIICTPREQSSKSGTAGAGGSVAGGPADKSSSGGAGPMVDKPPSLAGVEKFFRHRHTISSAAGVTAPTPPAPEGTAPGALQSPVITGGGGEESKVGHPKEEDDEEEDDDEEEGEDTKSSTMSAADAEGTTEV